MGTVYCGWYRTSLTSTIKVFYVTRILRSPAYINPRVVHAGMKSAQAQYQEAVTALCNERTMLLEKLQVLALPHLSLPHLSLSKYLEFESNSSPINGTILEFESNQWHHP